MREIMLFFHFTGLAMGIGTSFAYMFLGIASSKMEPKEAQKFILNAMSLSKMGYIGLGLLIFSGLYLITPYWKVITDYPLLIAKLALVLVLITLIAILGSIAQKAKKGNPEIYLKKIKILGRFSLLTGISIIILAIYNFK